MSLNPSWYQPYATKKIRRPLSLFVLFLGTLHLLPAATQAIAATDGIETHSEIAVIKGGAYAPLYAAKGDRKKIEVETFLLDRLPVTTADFRSFLEKNPRWRRSQVKRIFAEATYLKQWQSDLEPQAESDRRPVTQVSWFAAKAYCESKGKRLPTVAEWEYAALASESAADGRSEPAFISRILEWHSKPSPDMPAEVGQSKRNFWGVYDLHGLVWEWTADFNSMLITGESREDGSLNRDFYCGAGSTMTSEQAKVNYPAFLRAGFRSSLQGTYTTNNLGFRCAKDSQ